MVTWLRERILNWFLFPGALRPAPRLLAMPAGVESRSIVAGHGRAGGARVEYWFAPSAAAGPRATVVFAHGNGELIDDWWRALAPYVDLGANLVLAEFRGYGRSEGTPSCAALGDDFLQIVEDLVKRGDVDAQRLVYHGRSLGGGVVCRAAASLPPAGLVLESTFTSLKAMAARFHMPASVLDEDFDNLQLAERIACPCLLFHGDQDSLVPMDHARALAAALPRAKLRIMEGAGHNSPLSVRPAYWQELGALLGGLAA